MKAKEANELILKNFCEKYNLEVERSFHKPYFILANDTLKFSVKSLKGYGYLQFGVGNALMMSGMVSLASYASMRRLSISLNPITHGQPLTRLNHSM